VNHAIEVVDHIRVKLLHNLGVHPTHLLTASCKIANAVNKIFCEVRVLFVSIIHGVNTVIFRLEPFHGQLEKVDVSIEVLSYTCKCFQADLGHLEIVAVTAARNGLQYFVEILRRSLRDFRILGLLSVINFGLKHHRQVSAVLVHLMIPADHWFEPSFHALNDAMGEELIVIRQESRRLFRLHRKRSAESIQDEFQSALSL